ncbi:hypothetical protein [Massilia endophytica]|uniref:hypothetical protein n=1 Tax=Massilia endophytica TaxID=2899220 RepID=UPI001E28D306|nr:hypothetical protein [Massilia endophytica]UGQ48751.1 hypothetical protein LSQ66_09905 [Massilia endophytica]
MPGAVIGLLGAAGLLVLASLSLAVATHAADTEQEALRALRQSPRPPASASPAAASAAVPLPQFDSADFAHRFLGTARDVGLVTDEVGYTLETPPGQPYWRYRISLSVKTGYPQVRRFVAALASEMPFVALDAIRCTRENIGASALACELTFSAFFRRGEHG